jgi:hypothetical protein
MRPIWIGLVHGVNQLRPLAYALCHAEQSDVRAGNPVLFPSFARHLTFVLLTRESHPLDLITSPRSRQVGGDEPGHPDDSRDPFVCHAHELWSMREIARQAEQGLSRERPAADTTEHSRSNESFGAGRSPVNKGVKTPRCHRSPPAQAASQLSLIDTGQSDVHARDSLCRFRRIAKRGRLRILRRLPPRTRLGWLRRNRLHRRRLTDRPTFRHSSDELQLLEDRWKSLDFAQQQLLIRSFGEYRIRKGGRGAASDLAR